MRHTKIIVAVVLLVLIAAAGGGGAWYLSIPHTADEQFAYAEKLEKSLRTDAATQTFKQLQPRFDRVVQQYALVESKFGKSPKAADAFLRIGRLQEEIAKDPAKAAQAYEHLRKEYDDEPHAGAALMALSRFAHDRGEAARSLAKGKEASDAYKEAITDLEEYRKRFGTGPTAPAALMQIGRIWQDGIGDPLIKAIDTFQEYLKSYPQGDDVPEALYRLGQLMELAKSPDMAMGYYSQLIEKYPSSAWADKALFNRGKLLASKMDEQKKAAEDFERLQREHPQSSLAGAAAGAAQDARAASAKNQSEAYGRARYGGVVPTDTLSDKALPPTAYFEQFIKQKLDAEDYDLGITLQPADSRIRVSGTLNLVNAGDEKSQLLFMLEPSLTVESFSVNGDAAKVEHVGKTLQVALAKPLAAGAKAKVTFTYTGTFADPALYQEMAAPDEPPSGEPPPDASGPPPVDRLSTPIRRLMRQVRIALAASLSRDPQLAIGDSGYALSGCAWYPITIIGDLFNARITLHTPSGDEGVANGKLVSRDPAAGAFVFQTEHPVFGLYFIYGRLVERDEQVGAIHFYTYLRPANAGKSDAYIKTTNDILSYYATLFGPFPYEKMAIIDTPLPAFLGGVGPASLMMLQEPMVDRKDVPTFLLAHELAHQWFGNYVPIAVMHDGYSQWLSEGFATYADALYTEKTQGPAAFVKHMERYAQLYFQYTLAARTLPSLLTCSPSSPYYRPLVYEKGALALQALRKVMGNGKFFILMRRWVKDYHDKPTSVSDFIHLAGEVQGDDLGWLFDEWLNKNIFAHYKFTTVHIKDNGAAARPDARYTVTCDIAQPDDLVKMPVDFTCYGPKGATHTAANIMLDKATQTVEFACSFEPTKIVIDEANWVIKHPGADNIWPEPINPTPGEVH